MAFWSAEKATKAYLQALKMGKRGKELSEVEFLAAIAAGNNSQLMVMASTGGGAATDAALALVCASWQTGGRAVCILSNMEELVASRKALGCYADFVEFAVGDVWKLLSSDYKTADFVLINCKSGGNKERVVFPADQGGGRHGEVKVGYNARQGRWWRNGVAAQFLPIGEGLFVVQSDNHEKQKKEKNKCWVSEVDEFTGEQHFYKIRK